MGDQVPWSHGRCAARGRRRPHACRSRTARRRCCQHPRASADWYREWCCAFPSGRRCAFPCAKSQSSSGRFMHLPPTAAARYAAFQNVDCIDHLPRIRFSMRQCSTLLLGSHFLQYSRGILFRISDADQRRATAVEAKMGDLLDVDYIGTTLAFVKKCLKACCRCAFGR